MQGAQARPQSVTDEPPISILFAYNANYAQHGAACIASIIGNTTSSLEIVVVTAGDPEEFAPKLRESFKDEPRLHLEIRRFETPPADYPTPYYITKEAYFRFWAQDVFPGRSRALYLDSDIIVVGPLEELWATDLQGKTLGAVEIPNSARPAQHGMPAGSLYFNSGVLLIDLERLARRGLHTPLRRVPARLPRKGA